MNENEWNHKYVRKMSGYLATSVDLEYKNRINAGKYFLNIS
jgi:hypothetical protein